MALFGFLSVEKPSDKFDKKDNYTWYTFKVDQLSFVLAGIWCGDKLM